MKDYEKFMLDNYNEELYIIREVILDDKETYDSYTIYDIEKTVCGFMATMGLLAGKYQKEHLEWLLEVM